MATERQIQANRRNAALSTGPRTEDGKARSRANATRHGLAGESADLEAASSAEFLERRARWAAERPPAGEAAGWALDRAVAASLRIERCERAVDELTAATRRRARLAWDEDRAVEAATTFGRLARDPVLASRRLRATLAGVTMLVEAWLGLASALEDGGDWSESEASRALDLLGVAADLRSGRTAIDGPDGSDPVAHRQELALGELDRLEALREEAMEPLDEMERRLAMSGELALLSGPARLLLRYERDAWRRYRESIREVEAPPSSPSPAVVAPAPAVVDRPGELEGVATAPAGPSEERRPAPGAEAAPVRSAPMGPDDEPARPDEIGRLVAILRSAANPGMAPGPGRPPATERTHFAGGRVGPAS